MKNPFISVIIPVYNEENYIHRCVQSMLAQDHPRNAMEWFFVDGMSTDATRKILAGYQAEYPLLIRLLDNPQRAVPHAMNTAIPLAQGRYIIRLDAHAEYAPDYLSKCIEVLEETGADNAGGVMQTRARTKTGRAIAKMLSSPFGVGDSRFRTNGADGYADTVPFGAFRREVFDRVGLYDERLRRNQDSELNHRILRSGGRIYLSSKIRLTYYCRETVREIAKMGDLNGSSVVTTWALCPGSMRPRHFIPCLFTLSLLGMPLACLLWQGFRVLFGLELGAYLLLDILFSARAAGSLSEFARLMYLFPAFHIAYGWGSVRSILALLLKKT